MQKAQSAILIIDSNCELALISCNKVRFTALLYDCKYAQPELVCHYC